MVEGACMVPREAIAANAGFEGDQLERALSAVHGKVVGYDFSDPDALNKPPIDLIEAGIIDPARVVTGALRHAASVAGQVLACETLVVEVEPGEAEGDDDE